MLEEIWMRQKGLIDPKKLTMPILIVGAGSIGSWTALALGKLGCSNITVMDYDLVEPQNVGSQIYKSSDVGMNKIQALKERIGLLLENDINTIDEAWTPAYDLSNFAIVIACVDNITTRSQLFDQLQDKDVLYIDARMAGNALEIYTVKGNDEEDIKAYKKTLFLEGEEIPVECSERSVVYNVFIVSGLITDIVAKYANKQELPRELVMDLYNFTLFK